MNLEFGNWSIVQNEVGFGIGYSRTYDSTETRVGGAIFEATGIKYFDSDSFSIFYVKATDQDPASFIVSKFGGTGLESDNLLLSEGTSSQRIKTLRTEDSEPDLTVV
ncbi:MAG: hypothetical protein AAGF79_05845, partial [Pseudomonadota bacterium]